MKKNDIFICLIFIQYKHFLPVILMEDYSKTHSSQKTGERLGDTGFSSYTNKQSPAQFQLRNLPPEDKQSISNLMNTQNQYKQLSGIATTLFLELERIKQLNKSVSSTLNSQQAQFHNMQTYSEVASHNRQVQKQLQLKINDNMTKIGYQVADLYRARIASDKKLEKEVKKQIEELQFQKSKCISQFRKNQSQKCADMKEQLSNLKNQVNNYHKETSEFREQIFSNLNSIRANLHAQISEQEAKRKSYDEIVQNLLQKSCGNAQKILRRRM